METETQTRTREATELGENYGRVGGSWVIDGNTDEATARHIRQMISDGDPEWEIPAPLSGEWADGYTLDRLADELSVEQDADEFDDLCSAFEEGYYRAFEDEVVRSIKAQFDV